MYHKTISTNELNCNECGKEISINSECFDSSTYNWLYGKVEIQKSLCVECGEKYLKFHEDEYQRHEQSEHIPRIKKIIIMFFVFSIIILVLDYVGKNL